MKNCIAIVFLLSVVGLSQAAFTGKNGHSIGESVFQSDSLDQLKLLGQLKKDIMRAQEGANEGKKKIEKVLIELKTAYFNGNSKIFDSRYVGSYLKGEHDALTKELFDREKIKIAFELEKFLAYFIIADVNLLKMLNFITTEYDTPKKEFFDVEKAAFELGRLLACLFIADVDLLEMLKIKRTEKSSEHVLQVEKLIDERMEEGEALVVRANDYIKRIVDSTEALQDRYDSFWGIATRLQHRVKNIFAN